MFTTTQLIQQKSKMKTVVIIMAFLMNCIWGFSQKDTMITNRLNVGTINGDVLKDNAVKNVYNYKIYKIYKFNKIDTSLKEIKIPDNENFSFTISNNNELELSPKQGQYNKFFIAIPKKEWSTCGLSFLQPNIKMMVEEGDYYFNNIDTFIFSSFQQPFITKDYPCILYFNNFPSVILFGDISKNVLYRLTKKLEVDKTIKVGN